MFFFRANKCNFSRKSNSTSLHSLTMFNHKIFFSSFLSFFKNIFNRKSQMNSVFLSKYNTVCKLSIWGITTMIWFCILWRRKKGKTIETVKKLKWKIAQYYWFSCWQGQMDSKKKLGSFKIVSCNLHDLNAYFLQIWRILEHIYVHMPFYIFFTPYRNSIT